jgi:hypothetical protein
MKCEINELRLMNLTCLIKWVKLRMTYIILYAYFDMIRTRHVNMNYHSYFEPLTKCGGTVCLYFRASEFLYHVYDFRSNAIFHL